MAITQRFFSTAGAGAADGTSWANRAALFTTGNWSSVITGFAFNGSDALQCFIGPGSYTCSQSLASGLFANPPILANPLFLCGCDSSGVLLAIPDPKWLSCQPAWDASTLPVIATTTNIITINLANTWSYLLKYTASGRSGACIGSNLGLYWCVVINSQNAVAASAASGGRCYGSVLSCTGANYDTVFTYGTALTFTNNRVEGVAGSSSNRRGITVSVAGNGFIDLCTVVNNGGEGIIDTSTSAGQNFRLRRSVVANNASTGLKANSTASQTDTYEAHGNMITGNGTAGIDGNSAAARWFVQQNRLRDNTTDITGLGNYPIDLNNYTTDDSDANEYVSTGADGDFSIKNTASAIWGKGYGVRDQPAAGGAAQLVDSGALVG